MGRNPASDEEQINELYNLIGQAIHAWGDVESHLARFFVALTGIRDREMAFRIFDAIISFEARIKICSELVAYRRLRADIKTLAPGVLNYALKQHKKRHEIAHFGLTAVDGRFYIAPFPSRTKLRITLGAGLNKLDILKRRDRFTDLASSICWLSETVKRDPKFLGGRPKPTPDLIARLQKQGAQNS